MTKMKTVCKECGENVAVPKDFRKDKKPDPRLTHLKEKHSIEWAKGIFDERFSYPEEKPSEKKADAKERLKEKSKELHTKEKKLEVIKNRVNGNSKF